MASSQKEFEGKREWIKNNLIDVLNLFQCIKIEYISFLEIEILFFMRRLLKLKFSTSFFPPSLAEFKHIIKPRKRKQKRYP